MKVSEADFTRQILDLAALNGWRAAHFRPAQTGRGWRTAMSGDIGYPDVTLAKDGRLIVAELKAEGGRVRPEQVAWLRAIHGDDWQTWVWRPRDLTRIAALLRERPRGETT